MKKLNKKQITLAIAAIIIALATTNYTLNTDQLKGFTKLQTFQKQQLTIPTQNTNQPTRFEASHSDLNKSKIQCNGVWQKGLEFVINHQQTEQSINFVINKLNQFNKKGCQIAIQHQGVMPERRTVIPYDNTFTRTYYCNGDINSSQSSFECLIDDNNSYNGTSMMGFYKKYNSQLEKNDEIKSVLTINSSPDGQRITQEQKDINRQKTPYVINILVK